MKRLSLISLLSLALLCASAFANTKAEEKEENNSDPEISEILNSVGYPELQVVPRASERLLIEAKAERGSWFIQHWPVELSGLTTLYVGLTSKNNRAQGLTAEQKKDADSINAATTAVGAGWIVGGLILGAQMPYATGMRAIGRTKGKDDRSVLMRERLAEEHLENRARDARSALRFDRHEPDDEHPEHDPHQRPRQDHGRPGGRDGLPPADV
ncbi:MAG: hypothetical protein HC902_06130 [Calothrix sp. SM1_5_4]|nr:hypothetical protein [Calothrix sp. SM1_5_4]